MRVVNVIRGSELRPGMKVSRFGEKAKKPTETILALNSQSPKCGHGVHFGNGCYAKIGKWLLWE